MKPADRETYTYILFTRGDSPVTKTFTVDEAAVMMGVSRKSIYKYIKSGKLPFTTGNENGKSFKLINEEDLKQFISNRLITGNNQVNTPGKSGESIDIKQLVKEAIKEEQSAIMKPLEQQALYRLGKVEQENTFLKERIETLLQENQGLHEQMKLLPDLKEVLVLREECETYKLSASAGLEEKKRLQEEKSRMDCELESMKSQMQSLQGELQKAEQDKIEIAEKWKAELEAARRPWWKIW